jgi:uncharacterized protein YodC (DUF2158 family)
MADQLKVGDTVRLNSGGPLMTVTGIGDQEGGRTLIWCSWFTNDKEDRATFPMAAVEADDGM